MALRHGKRSKAALALGLTLLVLLVLLVLVEVSLHAAPHLLPRSYRERFPMHGVELFHPGILDETPIRGLPLPLVVGPFDGPPPADLVETGIAPPGAEEADRRRFPRATIPVDGRGLPNAHEPSTTDVLLVGDSFGVASATTLPRGLLASLAQATGLTFYNLSVSAIGPVRQRWLLEEVGLSKQPRFVLWFFFSGNDATSLLVPIVQERRGLATWGAAYADRRPPRLLLLDLLGTLADRPAAGPTESPLPGFRLVDPGGGASELWFDPDHLRQLALTRREWEEHPGWWAAREELRGALRACNEAGAELLLVYLPSKPEVYLPHVEPDPSLTHRTASRRLAEPVEEEPEAFLSACLRGRRALEEVVGSFCEQEGIRWLSATPFLEALAERGELAYFVADTHWQTEGQRVLVEPIRRLLRE
jgi:hypothetical protein